MELDPAQTLDHFKRDLIEFAPVDIARRYVVFGDCAVINSDQYFSLRKVVAEQFQLHPNDVLVVGSGKLGFSIAPKKRYRMFGDYSDLDVVIVSSHFFDLVWKDVHRYSAQGGYWEDEASFKKYLFRGWIRPDMLPADHRFEFKTDWWEFFNSLSASREYSVSRVRGAIYKSWYFLESYQEIAISACARELIQEQGELHEN